MSALVGDGGASRSSDPRDAPPSGSALRLRAALLLPLVATLGVARVLGLLLRLALLLALRLLTLGLLALHGLPPGLLALRLRGLAAFEGPFLLQTRLDDPSFAQKWRWQDYEASPDDDNGGYHHGTLQELTAADRARIEELKTMARAWGAVLDGNRVMPPGATR